MSNKDGRGRAPKISLDLSNSVSHNSNPNNTIDSNMLFPGINNNAIYSRRSLSRVTSRSTANISNRSRSKSRRSSTNNTLDTDNSDYDTISSVSNRTSESRSIHDSNLRADLKFSILNKNPYTERIRIIHSDVDSDDSDDSEHSFDSYADGLSDYSIEHEVPSLSKKRGKKEGRFTYSSDEEKILDANDEIFKNQLKYNFTDLVMPNTDMSFKDLLEHCKEWINKYRQDYNNQLEPELLEDIDHKMFCDNTCEKLTLVFGDENNNKNPFFHRSVETNELHKTYILQTDGSLETIAYVITTILKPQDQLYIVCHLEQATLVKLTQLLISTAQKVLSVFDHVNTSIDLNEVLINITILKHHYPKHFLSGLIHAVRPVLVIVNMTILKGWLNGFVCGVPLLVFKREPRSSSLRV